MLKLTREEVESVVRTLDWVLSATQADDEQREITETVMYKLIHSLKTTRKNISFEVNDEIDPG